MEDRRIIDSIEQNKNAKMDLPSFVHVEGSRLPSFQSSIIHLRSLIHQSIEVYRRKHFHTYTLVKSYFKRRSWKNKDMYSRIWRMIAVASTCICRQVRSFGKTLPQRASTIQRSSYSHTPSLWALSEQDEEYLAKAVDHAKNALGRTYPNPAVGCILVEQNSGEIIGSGFHPRAGFPHAEIFALLEATGHVEDGVAAAKSVIAGEQDESLRTLMGTYSQENGPQELFGGAFESSPVTAYVTLEPCCHYGQTPPCAVTFSLSKIDRVVVGFRDPNPRVDGGGVKLLQEAGVSVDMAEGDTNDKCASIVDYFVKRITPKSYEDFSWINGAMRRAIRKIAGTQKAEDSMAQMNWTGKTKATNEESVDKLDLDAFWMNRVDEMLWKDEIVNLRLNKAVGKKKLAKRLGERVAQELGAHVAQTVGHTALLYRPGVPPVLDLYKMIEPEDIPHTEEKVEFSLSNIPEEESSPSNLLTDMTVVQLKELLKAKGLKVSGRKDELIDRLGQEA
jgi:diaminohydroxyphosphoribosylaminopyrimidine deaminase/5-amino-6-(5-phosphoribosylamino)uracil reductase